jgi:hypothetical protein
VQDREKAFSAITCFWFACGALLLLLVLTIDRDEEDVQVRIHEWIYVQIDR